MDKLGDPRTLVKTIRQADAEIESILDRLDAESDPSAATLRKSERYSYRHKAIVRLQQPGGSNTVSHVVRTRNLSRGGISFLLGGFVHNNTRCTIQLTTPHGTWNGICGTVVRCRYVEGNLHEVGVRFDQNIDPATYCSAAVHARVLLAEDGPTVARLVIFHLKKLNAHVDHAENGRDAIDKAMHNVYDVILMDMDMPVIDGFAAVRELRGGGYTGMIVAATGMTEPGDRERCLSAGCDRYIAKPYQRQELCDLLESFRGEPLVSRFCNDLSMIGIIDAFVTELPAKVRALQGAAVQRDVNRLQRLTRALKGEGSSYGFDVITQAAAQIEKALIKGCSIDDVSKDVRELVKLCGRARSSAGITAPPDNQSKKDESNRKSDKLGASRSAQAVTEEVQPRPGA